MRLGFITSRLRVEEKQILSALESEGVAFERFDDGELQLGLTAGSHPILACGLVWNRSLSFGRALYATAALEALGVPSVNSARVIETSGDKARTTMALATAGIPQVATRLAFTPEAAVRAIEELGYPAVIKPVVGSWGRQVARVDDRNAAEALLETRAALGGWQSGIFFVQEYIEKPGRDLRVFVSSGRAVAAIARNSQHWITNTARGATVEGIELTPELVELALATAAVIGGPWCQVAVDLVEAPDGLRVLEVNHSAEFKNSSGPTGVDIAGVLARDVALRLRTIAESPPKERRSTDNLTAVCS